MGARAFVSGSAARSSRTIRLPRVRGGVDVILLITAVALVIFGLLMLYSASYDYSVDVLGKDSPTYLFDRQVLWLGLGVIGVLALSQIDYHHWRRLVIPAMAIILLSLIAVLLIGDERLGATRALLQGSVQPSEYAKFIMVIYLAVWLYSKRDQLHDIQIGLLPLGIILGLVGGLIFLQPDLSAAATVLVLGGLLFFLAGADLRQIVLMLLAAMFMGWLVVQFSATGRERIIDYWQGLLDPVQSSYHVARSFEAIINGGWLGVGLGLGRTKLLGLPVPPTDSIFAVVVEELGFLGSLFLIGLYALLVWRGLVIARRAPDLLGALMAGGMSLWIGLEALINMGVMVGIIPFAGNALPFVSSGGSNLTAMLAAIGILLNVSRQTGKPAAEPVSQERSIYGATIDLRRRDRRGRISRPSRLASR